MLESIVALALFVAVFALATVRKVHLGVIMFASAAGVGIWLAGMEMDDVIAGFPVSILVLLVGVTYFFAIAQANGTVDKIITFAISRVGDRAALLPLVFFGLTAGIAAMGSPLAGLVMTPIGMPLAKKYGIDRMLMGLAIGCGLSAGGFAPTSLFGIVTYGTAHSVGIDLNPLTLFSIALVANLVLLLAAYMMFGGLGLLRRRHTGQFGDGQLPNLQGKVTLPGHPFEREGFAQRSQRVAQQVQVIDDTVGETTPERFTWAQRTTVLCMAGLVVSVILLAIIGLDPDIGILCFAFATVMTLVDPKTGKTAVSKIDWSTVLMVGGIITFVGVLQEIGAVDLLGEAASQAGAPLVAALCICIIGGLVSAFASTTGMLAALVPLAIPLVADGNIAGWAVIAALGVCSSVVDVSPFSTVGATLVATVDEEERPRITKVLTRWGLSLVVVGPVALVGTLVLPTML
ncbi:SLC13 family permease [Crystallibacter degradans]|uniref:SLC13 family permease n=1 Tax=Crystallibacter degradans TaxID=2726743 RepID=UPI001475C3B1|nr:SLC13 family permease [Arthrobacter sp. SF27]NMR29234.1 C4-dicarboxylate ABC transporter [Arthrobacter sp. SF27]